MPSHRRPWTGPRIVTFEQWGSGEYGERDPSQAAHNSFTGDNVSRYDTGLLGPRFGVKAMTLSGPDVGSAKGIVRGLGINPTITGVGPYSTWFVIDDKAFLMKADGTTVTIATGSFNAVATSPVYGVPTGTATYITGPEFDGVYKLDHGALTLAKVVGSPANADFIFRYGQVLITTGPFNKFNWSNLNDPTTWPAGNVFYIGGAGSYITGAIAQRDHALFVKLEGGWYLLRGSLGQTGTVLLTNYATLNKITETVSVPGHDSMATLQGGNVAFVRGSSDWAQLSALFWHTGSAVEEVAPYIPFSTGDSSYYDQTRHQVIGLRGPTDWMALSMPSLGQGEVALHVSGAWSKHHILPAGGTFPALGRQSLQNDPSVLLCDTGAAATTPKFWWWVTNQRRPAFTSDGYGQPGDASTTPFEAHFTTYEYQVESQLECRVERVTIDFRSWTTGSPASNHFDVSVINTKILNGVNVESPVQSYDDPGGAGGDTGKGVQHSLTLDFNNLDQGRGFKVKIANLRGIAIERITAHLMIEEWRT